MNANSLALGIFEVLPHCLLFGDLIGRDLIRCSVDEHDHRKKRSPEQSERHATD